MINSNKIKGRLKEMDIPQHEAAKHLGIAQPTLNQKLCGVRQFKVSEVEKLIDLMKIDDKDVAEYFFCN